MARKRGMTSHQSAACVTETWLTPPHIVRALGEFDLDPCAAPLPRPWTTARQHYAMPEQDGLALPWFGRVWLNPPYGRAMTPFLARMAAHGVGTALIFARTETKDFFNHVWDRADALLFLRNRLHFHFPDGARAKANGGAPSVLIAYGRDDAERLMESGLDGQYVPLHRALMIHFAVKGLDATASWREVVVDALRNLGGQGRLSELYAALEGHPKAGANRNWRAKVRQTLARAGLSRVDEATYAVAV